MGKRLIIKGADFSANGMKSIQYMNVLYSTYIGLLDNPIWDIVGEGMPITSINIKEATIEIDAILRNNMTHFEIFKGSITDDYNTIRTYINKNYKSDHVTDEPFDLYVQHRSGAASTKFVDTESGIDAHIVITPLVVTLNGNTGSEIAQFGTEKSPIIKGGIYGCPKNSTNTNICVKYKRIAVKDADGNLLVNYLPAIGNGGKACLYDTVSETFIYPSDDQKWVAE